MIPMNLARLRQIIREHTLCDESELLQKLVADCALNENDWRRIADDGAKLVGQVRKAGTPTLMEKFLTEFGLSSKEGVALMCLAEALLRVPDVETIDALIADKIAPSDWGAHLGKGGSMLVNVSAWALMLTGRVLSAKEEENLTGVFHSLRRRLGEPVIRAAVGQAMKEAGRQFVLGETMEAAQVRGGRMEARGYSYSFDMLGEAAVTMEDAERYYAAYADAIGKITMRATALSSSKGVRENPAFPSNFRPCIRVMKREKNRLVLRRWLKEQRHWRAWRRRAMWALT